MSELAKHEARLAEIESQLAAVESALRRLDEGTYAKCEICEASISDEILTSDPTAIRCADHAEAS